MRTEEFTFESFRIAFRLKATLSNIGSYVKLKMSFPVVFKKGNIFESAKKRKSGKLQKIKLMINIEAQKKWNPGYEIVTGGIFYCARMI